MIRIAEEQDVPEILSIYAPYVLETTHTFEYDVPTAEEFLARFRSITAAFPWLVWEEEGRVLGYAYAGAPWERAAYRWCAEISVYLHPDIHGRGIGRMCRCYCQIPWLSSFKNFAYRLFYCNAVFSGCQY